MALIPLVLATALATAAPPADAVDCAYPHAALLALPVDAFDQDMDGGWRELDNRGCQQQAADLIAEYRRQPKAAGITILPWHEAQIRAELGQNARAAALMRQSLKPTDQDRGGWNLYVQGSIAFLEQDRSALEQARAQLARLPPPPQLELRDGFLIMQTAGGEQRVPWPPNLSVLDGLLRCFDKDYQHAYSSAQCRPELATQGT